VKVLSITPGMIHRYQVGTPRIKYVCSCCGLMIPIYRGRYPSFCPSCGGELVLNSENIATSAEEPSVSEKVSTSILSFLALPLLDRIDKNDFKVLYEAEFALSTPAFRPVTRGVLSFYESCSSPGKGFAPILAIKTLCRHTGLVINEEEAEKIASEARKITTESLSVKSPLLYIYARTNQLIHTEAKELSDLALQEDMWQQNVPSSSVFNYRNRVIQTKYIPWVSGGFRFHTKQSPDTLQKLQTFQRRIIAKRAAKNFYSRVASIRQILQRREALKKAKQWHKVSPWSKSMHQGLGMLLHRANECREPQRLYLRLFSDGSPYYNHTVWSYSLSDDLLESQIKRQKVYRLNSEVLTATERREQKSIRIPANTEIRIHNTTPAARWHGDYPSPPVGQMIFDIEIMDGDHKGEYHEVDGEILANALGLDEGVRLDTTIPQKSHKNGAVYYNKEISEIVITSSKILLTEEKIGGIIREIHRKIGSRLPLATSIRVVSENLDEAVLQDEIRLSRVDGRKYRCQAGFLLEEKDPRVEAIRQKYLTIIQEMKASFVQELKDLENSENEKLEAEKEKRRVRFYGEVSAIKQQMAKEIADLKVK